MPVSSNLCAHMIGRNMTETEPIPPTVDKETRPGRRAAVWLNPWLIIALLALGLAAWQWVETRISLSETQQELTRRLAANDTLVKESLLLSRQSQEQLATLQDKFGELEAKVAESKSQQATLEQLYQDLARNRDEWALAEIEQGVTLAAQQLQLAGNIQGAVLTLQSAEARLAASSRPNFVGLSRVLARDLERLRALPQIDLPRMNAQLESVIAAGESLPLAVNSRPRVEGKVHASTASPTITSQAYWQGVAADFWHELRGLVRIQRFDREEPALLAPEQAFFLRENLKLRLLSARLALLAHDQWNFRNELRQASIWLDRYFDGREKPVQIAQETLTQLSATEINIELPNLNESLSAIKRLKLGGRQ